NDQNVVSHCAVLPATAGTIGYRQRLTSLRRVNMCFGQFESEASVEYGLSALYGSYVDSMYIESYYMRNPVLALLSQYASVIHVKDLVCWKLQVPYVGLDHGLFYAAFNQFASIQSLTCDNLSIALHNELRNLCQAKGIAFIAK
ncbi:hypothetical protein AAVH_36668, partial [Aphelenchoides avenae]